MEAKVLGSLFPPSSFLVNVILKKCYSFSLNPASSQIIETGLLDLCNSFKA